MSSPSNVDPRRFPIFPPPGVIAMASEIAFSKKGSEETNHATSARVFERTQAFTVNAISNTQIHPKRLGFIQALYKN